jgi:hypothetical protein
MIYEYFQAIDVAELLDNTQNGISDKGYVT